MKKVLVVALALAALMGGCETTYQRKQKLDLAEYANYLKGGTGVIEGQAFFRTAGGEVRTAAGLPVWVNPVTSYSREWWENSVLPDRKISEADPQTPLQKSDTADAQGNFRIEGLAPGKYYVVSVIRWMYAQNAWTGGYVCAEAEVENGKVTKVIVTR